MVAGPSWATPGASTGRGTAFALVLGALAGIILSPCATPVLIAVLGLAATLSRAGATALLLAYGLGRAVPLLAIGVSSDLVSKALARPRDRAWAGLGRSVLGVAVLGLAFYFLYLGV